MRPTSLFLEDMIHNTPKAKYIISGSTPPFTGSAETLQMPSMDTVILGGEEYAQRLTQGLAKKMSCPANEVKLSLGSSQVLTQTLATLTDVGDTIWIEKPTYEPFVVSAKVLGLKVQFFNRTQDAEQDLAQLKQKIKNTKIKPKIILVSNPHCPLGVHYTKEELLQFSKLTKYLIVDEDFTPQFFNGQLSLLAGDRPANILTIGSFSKSLGLGQIRLGWLRATSTLAKKFEVMGYGFHIVVPAPSLVIGERAVANWDRLMAPNLLLASENRKLWQQFHLDHPGLLSHDFACGFFAVLRAPRKFKDGDNFAKELLKHDYWVRPARLFNLPQHIRFHILFEPQAHRAFFDLVKRYV